MTEQLSRKEQLEKSRKALEDQQKTINAELDEIRQEEQNELERQRFHHVVKILDAGDTLISLMDHERTSCSDENLANGHTTRGRGGNFRCKKCGFMKAVEEWKSNRNWLINDGRASFIEDYLSCYFGPIDLDILTEVE